jgi:molybdopterin-synthase adenylyltransferase
LPVIDPDRLEESNVNRVVPTKYSDVGDPKALILARHLSNLGSTIVPVVARAQSSDGRRWLERSDLVLGAVDGMRARDSIERICRTALVPYIDIGLSIIVDDKFKVIGIGGQVFVSLPGRPCMRCARIITEESLAADREEYIAGSPEQQVISMNGILASQAVTAGISLLTDYAADYPIPLHLQYDGLAHGMRANTFLPGACLHYPLASAGWTALLPPKRNAA